MLRQFDETFPSWIGADFHDGVKGYTYKEAENRAKELRDHLKSVRGIQEIRVTIVPIEGGFFKVTNTSTYKSDLKPIFSNL